uniref:Putative secreted protein n=1 Tax=Anopheles darlingi TaxID=43151 RepID=A0A2M4D3W5_ANODA
MARRRRRRSAALLVKSFINLHSLAYAGAVFISMECVDGSETSQHIYVARVSLTYGGNTLPAYQKGKPHTPCTVTLLSLAVAVENGMYRLIPELGVGRVRGPTVRSVEVLGWSEL